LIRIYPSRLDGEPLEVHAHGRTTIHRWMRSMVRGYEGQGEHPIQIDVDGETVPPDRWTVTEIDGDSDVRIYPVPHGEGVAGIIYWAVTAIVAAYAIYMLNNLPSAQNTTGNTIDLNPARANTARLGAPIREVLGRRRVYPDYLLQPVNRFVNATTYQTQMFVCVGVGQHVIPPGEMRIGATPLAAFGDAASYTIYPPGADVSGDPRSENWWSSTEVGGTNSGTPGLDTKETANSAIGIVAGSVTVQGDAITFDDIQNDGSASNLQDLWSPGMVVTARVAASFQARNDGLYSVISGAAVDELAPTVGMPVTLEYNDSEYSLFVASYTAGTPPIPGVGGSSASITGSAALAGYDFSGPAAVTFTVVWQSNSYVVSLNQDYGNIATLADAITTQMAGSGLVATYSGAVLKIGESASPWIGGAIGYSILPVQLFGASPVEATGVASTGGTPAQLPNITLAYESATGTAFSGLPEFPVVLSLSYGTGEYRVGTVSGNTATLTRLNPDGSTDSSWPGWTPRSTLDFTASGFEENDRWLGPFLACPDGETTTAFEVDFSLPNGLASYSSKGRIRGAGVTVAVQYRAYNAGAAWITQYYTYSDTTIDAKGFTHRIVLGTDSQVEVRARRISPIDGGNTRESVYWQGLRSRLSTRPASYPGVTTIGLTINTGTKLAAQSDRRFSVVATRQYEEGTARTISGALYHVLHSVGFGDAQIDRDTIDWLESTYWTPRGEFLDLIADGDNTSALDALQTISAAGMGYFLLQDGLCSAGREGVKARSGGITPQEMAEEMETAFKAPGPDDFDGIDVNYVDSVTWAEETVECRTGSDTPRKVEKVTLDGVTNRNVAYRIGMRRLMKHQHQRITHTVRTEMDAWVYNFGDRLLLTDDIPGSDTLSAMIDDASLASGVLTIRVGEYLDWEIDSPRCLIRFQDGSLSSLLEPTRIDGHTLTVPAAGLDFDTWAMDDPHIEPPRLIFCSSTQQGYDATVTEISADGAGRATLTAIEYKPAIYAHDDAIAP